MYLSDKSINLGHTCPIKSINVTVLWDMKPCILYISSNMLGGTHSYSTMVIETPHSTNTFLQFYPTTWFHICEGHNYGPFRTLCRQSQLPKTLHGKKLFLFRVAKIPSTKSPGRINFIGWCPMFVGPKYVTYSTSWRILVPGSFGCPLYFWKYVHPVLSYL